VQQFQKQLQQQLNFNQKHKNKSQLNIKIVKQIKQCEKMKEYIQDE
jgi:hypothetical protein